MIKINRVMLAIYFLLLSAVCTAQTAVADEKPAMAFEMRSNGKIYVVVAVVLTIFTGLIAYLISLDRKINRLEKESKHPAA